MGLSLYLENTAQNNELFISGTVHSILMDNGWPPVTEIMKSETVDEGDYCIIFFF